MNILAMSDLHGRIPKLPPYILSSRIDAMILGGDITPNFSANWDTSRWKDRRVNVVGEAADQKTWFIEKFMPWTKKFKELNHILFVAGNHDWVDAHDVEGVEFLKTGSKTVTIDEIKIGMLAGSMRYSGEWHDEVDEYEMNERIKVLDQDIDILISHVPPMGVRDLTNSGHRIGCVKLREAIFGISSAFDSDQQIVSPFFSNLQHHFFGHVHERNGSESQDIDGRTVNFHNAAETYKILEFNKD